jgi:photosystem II stability/assembly factor-like uncharacterized protein
VPSASPSVSSGAPSSNNDYRLQNISFISKNIGYALLAVGIDANNSVSNLIKTTDGGKTWSIINDKSPLNTIAFINEQTGYGLMNLTDNPNNNGSTLVLTNDRGVNWTPMPFKANKIVILQVLNQNTLFVAVVDDNTQPLGPVYNLYCSMDSGKTFKSIPLPAENNYGGIGEVYFVSPACGYALCGGEPGAGQQAKALYYTSDAGKTWLLKSRSDHYAFNGTSAEGSVGNLTTSGYASSGMMFFADGTGYMNLNRNGVFKTTDGGINFITVIGGQILGADYICAPDMINESEGYVLDSSEGTLMRIVNGGKNWHIVTTSATIATQLNFKN